MKHKELFSLLDAIQEDQEIPTQNRHDRVLILDGLNLFFRNFAMMNMVNPDGKINTPDFTAASKPYKGKTSYK